MTKRALVLVVVLMSTFTFPLTITGASVALTDIADDLDAGLAATQWVVNGYNACFASFLVFAGSLADVLGRRRIYVAGLALFVGGGIACTVAGNIVVLDVVRLIAGTGAAAAVTGGLAILTETFQGAARTRAFGLVGTVLGIGLAFGPSIGGLLVDLLGWRAVFGAPAAVAALVLALTPLLPAVPGTAGRRIDWAGAGLFTGAIMLLIFALVEAGELGFGHPLVVGGLLLAAVLAVVFPFVERRRADPLFDLALLANRGFTSLAVAAGALVTILVPLLVYLPSYLIEVVRLSAGEAGLWLLMLTAPTVLFPAVGAALARRLPPSWFVAGAVAVSGAGAFLLMTMNASSGVLSLLAPLVLVGAGTGLTMGLLDGLAIGSVGPEHSGTAAGMFTTARLATETIAIAVVGAVLASITGGNLSGESYTDAFRIVCFALGCVGVLGTVSAAVLSPRREAVPVM
ncbi:MFS transporter [Amycolatopsis orientalis]|uniref:MFS transporter n=1 Tax=Amycolatopsis orientalis TaxID=31958 RepID=UPI000410191A|nr:MFS transporter [Amycolatopsis orientalis]